VEYPPLESERCLVQCVGDDGKELIGIEGLGDPAAPPARARASTAGSQLADMTVIGNEPPILVRAACSSRSDMPGMSTSVTTQPHHSCRNDARKCSALSKEAEL
jgi:hypothetical protein